MKKIIILASAEMGTGTTEAKFVPIINTQKISKIYVLRKSKGIEINGVEYLVVPKLFRGKISGLIFRPLLLLYYALKLKPGILLAYHLIPHLFFVAIVGYLCKIPYIIGQTGLSIQEKNTNNKVLRFFILKALKHASYLNVPGTKSYEFWKELGVSEKKINLLHSTIDTDKFHFQNSQKKYDFIVLGGLCKGKRIDLIINILYKLKEEGHPYKAVIVGDGEERVNLLNQVKKLNLSNHIEFVGFQKNTANWFNSSKYFLMHSESEGLPTALMQAMACHLIPIVTNVGNIPDLVNPNNGFLIEFGDEESYRKSLITLLKADIKSLTSLQLSGRSEIEQKHSYKYATHKWIKLIEDIK